MNDPGLVQTVRAFVVIVGIAMVAFVLIAASAIINDSERGSTTAIFLITGWILLVGGFRLIRAGSTGKAEAFDRLRASIAARRQHIRDYHGSEG